jgi:hypothetical protein
MGLSSHTTIPSAGIIDLCNQLCLIYDACIYRPALAIPRAAQGHDEDLLARLDTLYDALMTVSTKYRRWMAAMKHIGDDFTKPTMRRILQSPAVMQSILEFEGQLEAAMESVVQMELETASGGVGASAAEKRRREQVWKHGASVLHRGHASVS